MSGPVETPISGAAPPPPKGRLKVFLGYAAGVGKTYQMLDEAQELRRKGVDVVVGYFEPHGRQDTIAKTADLEFIPRKKIEYRGSVFEEMNTPAILERHAAIALVDELPHTNIPGCERLKRWEDVIALRQRYTVGRRGNSQLNSGPRQAEGLSGLRRGCRKNFPHAGGSPGSGAKKCG